MHPDDDLRNRLDRLVAPPDSRQGWEALRVRSRRAQRRREGLIATCAAVVVVVLLGTVAIVVGSNQEPQLNVSTINGESTSLPSSSSTLPDIVTGSTGTVPGQTSAPPHTGPSGGGGGFGITTLPPAGDTGGAGGTGVFGGSGAVGGTTPGGGSVVTPGDSLPGGTAATLPPSGGGGAGTTTTPVLPPISEVKDGIQTLLNKHPGTSRGPIGQGNVDGRDVATVHLRADAVQLAEVIQHTWPTRTQITLGFFSYPKRTAPSDSPCGAGSVGATVPPLPYGLVGATTLSSPTVAAGADFSGKLTVTNKGTSVVDFTADSTVAVQLYRPAGGSVVGCSDALVKADNVRATLAAGASADIALVGGSASADPVLGWALPAGAYVGVARFSVGAKVVTVRFPVAIS